MELVHVSELRGGDLFRWDDDGPVHTVTAVHRSIENGEQSVLVLSETDDSDHSDRCVDAPGEPVMVQRIRATGRFDAATINHLVREVGRVEFTFGGQATATAETFPPFAPGSLEAEHVRRMRTFEDAVADAMESAIDDLGCRDRTGN